MCLYQFGHEGMVRPLRIKLSPTVLQTVVQITYTRDTYLVDLEGIEPPTFCLQSRRSPPELQALNRSSIRRLRGLDNVLSSVAMATRMGFEPIISAVTGQRLNQPDSRAIINWCAWRDSNSHGCPLVPKTSASTNSATSAYMVRDDGIEIGRAHV